LANLAFSPSPGYGEGELPNLIPNPEFMGPAAGKMLPRSWHRERLRVDGVKPGRVFIWKADQPHTGRLLALMGGPDRGGRVWCRVRGIQPHTDYLLEFLAYRPHFTNDVYLEVEIFGQRQLINQHLLSGQVQRIFLHLNSGSSSGDTRLVFENPHPELLAFGFPALRPVKPDLNLKGESSCGRLPNFFPVGIYAATLEGLPEIRAAGFNSIQNYNSRPEFLRQMAGAATRHGLKLLATLGQYQPAISRELGGQPAILGFYIEDEPEGRSVPPESLQSLKKRLQKDHPGVLTAMAMIRPRLVAEYKQAADVFLLDPYPVPRMPMTWLSETLDEAARHVSRERLWAVIQAFGGGSYRQAGWPRLPTYLEMRCLTYLALVHGAHGLFYFSYPDVKAEDRAWEGLKKIVGQLRQLRTWLMVANDPVPLSLEILSPLKVDASGRPAVHFCLKRRGKENLLILVNVLDRSISFLLSGFPPKVEYLSEIFLKQKSVVLDSNIREKLGPYEVRIYRYPQNSDE
jgi:hypothetical protein